MRDLSQRMMRASTSFAEGKTFTLLLVLFKRVQKRDSILPLEGCTVSVLPSSFLSSMFPWTCFSAPRDRKRGRERKSFFSTTRSKERERERTTRERRIRVFSFFFQLLTPLFFFPFVLERARTKNAQKKNRFRPDDDREKTRRILLPVLLLAE